MNNTYTHPRGDKGVYDFSGFNDLDMKVIFAMTPEYNDDENENRPTEELLRTSLREVNVGHLDYGIADYTLDNMHLIIDNNEVECINGAWQEVKEFYFDKQTRVGFKITRPTSTNSHSTPASLPIRTNTIGNDLVTDYKSSFIRIDKLYVAGGSGAASRINNFLNVNNIKTGLIKPSL